MFSRQRKIWSFHAVVLQRMAKKCTTCNARAQLLHCFSSDVAVAVAIAAVNFF